jgi:hypothetical protein
MCSYPETQEMRPMEGKYAPALTYPSVHHWIIEAAGKMPPTVGSVVSPLSSPSFLLLPLFSSFYFLPSIFLLPPPLCISLSFSLLFFIHSYIIEQFKWDNLQRHKMLLCCNIIINFLL